MLRYYILILISKKVSRYFYSQIHRNWVPNIFYHCEISNIFAIFPVVSRLTVLSLKLNVEISRANSIYFGLELDIQILVTLS